MASDCGPSGISSVAAREVTQYEIRSLRERISTDMSLIDVSNDEIFIVDDDTTVCDLLTMAFVVDGYHVTPFRDSASFMALARQQTPACALIDLLLPGKSGLDILKELDARNYPAPILMMSGGGDIPTAVEAIKNGAIDFLEK